MPGIFQFKLTHPNAKLPVNGKPGDIGWDLACVEDFTLAPGQTFAVDTGLQLADAPKTTGDDCFLQVVSRSGLSLKGVYTLGGIIDNSYRGEIKVILHNGNPPVLKDIRLGVPVYEDTGIEFKAGDRVAQLLVQRVWTDNLSVPMFGATDVVTETVRGADGFGSTDKPKKV